MPNKKIDDIPAMLTEGEYVIKKDSAKKLGYKNLDMMNETGELPMMDAGGRVKKIQGYGDGGKVMDYNYGGKVMKYEDGGKVTKKEEKLLKKHSKHHSTKHMKEMKKDIIKGDSFTKSHNKAMKKVGK